MNLIEDKIYQNIDNKKRKIFREIKNREEMPKKGKKITMPMHCT